MSKKISAEQIRAPKPKVVWHSLTKASIYTEINISAPASLVWKTMMDAKNMPNWSRTFQGFSGDFGLHKTIDVDAKTMGRVVKVQQKLAFYEAGKEFGWSGKSVPGIKDRHIFQVNPVSENESLFVQTDELNGYGVWIFGLFMMEMGKSIFTKFNVDLKLESERRFEENK